jgi:peptide/nickel transport system permease protein
MTALGMSPRLSGLRVVGAATRFATAPGWGRRIGAIGVLLIVVVAIFAPLLAPYGPTQQNLLIGAQAPSLRHWFGTDELGQDVFSRVLFAARVDLAIGAVGVSVSLVFGTMLGLFSGYFGGWFDQFVGRVVDVFTAFPFIVLVIAIVAMLGPGLRNLFIAIVAVSWVPYVRIIRGQVLSVKHREYVLAARALGYSDVRIVLRHILPNVIPAVIVFAMSDFVLDILAGAALGFFGLGVQPPTPEWGVMIADGRDYIITQPWIVFFPGLAIVVTGFFFSLLGDGIADYIRRLDRG